MFCDAYFKSASHKDIGWFPEDRVNVLKKICKCTDNDDYYLVQNLENEQVRIVRSKFLIFFKNKDLEPCIPIDIKDSKSTEEKLILTGFYNDKKRVYEFDYENLTIFEIIS